MFEAEKTVSDLRKCTDIHNHKQTDTKPLLLGNEGKEAIQTCHLLVFDHVLAVGEPKPNVAASKYKPFRSRLNRWRHCHTHTYTQSDGNWVDLSTKTNHQRKVIRFLRNPSGSKGEIIYSGLLWPTDKESPEIFANVSFYKSWSSIEDCVRTDWPMKSY